jgi:hypothetical protein
VRLDAYVAQGLTLEEALVKSRADAVSQTIAAGKAADVG